MRATLSMLAILAIFVIAIISPVRLAFSDVTDKAYVAGWELNAYTDDKTHKFTACLINMPYTTGTSLFFYIDRGFAWSMVLYNPTWQLQKGASYLLSYAIDSGRAVRTTARVTDAHMVEVPLPGSDGLFNEFQRGRQLRVDAAGGSFVFDLAGSSTALTAALDCVHKRVDGGKEAKSADPSAVPAAISAPAPESAPVQSQAASQPAPADGHHGPNDAQVAEAIAFMSNLLSTAGVDGFTILSRQEAKKIYEDYAVVWKAADAIGAVLIASNDDIHNMDKAMGDVSSADAQKCAGKFASARQPVEKSATQVVLGRLVTACEEASGSYENYYMFLPRAAGGAYVIQVTGAKGEEEESTAQLDYEKLLRAVDPTIGDADGQQ